MREPKFALNLPAVIKQTPPTRLRSKCYERQCVSTPPGSSRVMGGSCGAWCFLGAGIQPLFSRQVNAGMTCENVNAGVNFRGCTGEFGGTGAPLCTSAFFHRRPCD